MVNIHNSEHLCLHFTDEFHLHQLLALRDETLNSSYIFGDTGHEICFHLNPLNLYPEKTRAQKTQLTLSMYFKGLAQSQNNFGRLGVNKSK